MLAVVRAKSKLRATRTHIGLQRKEIAHVFLRLDLIFVSRTIKLLQSHQLQLFLHHLSGAGSFGAKLFEAGWQSLAVGASQNLIGGQSNSKPCCLLQVAPALS